MSGQLRTAFISIGVFFGLMWAGLALTIYLAFKDHEAPLIEHPELSRQSELRRGTADLLTDWPDSLPAGKHEIRLSLNTKEALRDSQIRISIERPASRRDALELHLDHSQSTVDGSGMHFTVPVELRVKGSFDLSIHVIYNKQYETFYQKRFQVL
ncbi:MAG: hypothetical protein HS115_04850 [Spirochaetales bacterium]|nr:hypothetical protein [Spirochaetales bacterium]